MSQNMDEYRVPIPKGSGTEEQPLKGKWIGWIVLVVVPANGGGPQGIANGEFAFWSHQ